MRTNYLKILSRSGEMGGFEGNGGHGQGQGPHQNPTNSSSEESSASEEGSSEESTTVKVGKRLENLSL